ANCDVGRKPVSAGPAKIKISCVHCSTHLKVEPRYIGRTVKCPKCGKSFQAVTEPIAMIDDDPRDDKDDAVRSSRKPSSKRQKLRQIALYQRVVLICVLIYIVLIAAQFTVEPGMRPLIFGPIALLDGLVGAVFVFLLSLKVYSTA